MVCGDDTMTMVKTIGRYLLFCGAVAAIFALGEAIANHGRSTASAAALTVFLLVSLVAGRIIYVVRRYRRYLRTRRIDWNLCPTCGYSLRGTLDHCPECGWIRPPAGSPSAS